MNIIKNYSTKEKIRLFGLFLIYIIFCVYTIHLIKYEKNIYSKILFLNILILFMFISLWSEYLKFLYQKSIYYLNVELDCNKAIYYFEKLIRKDFFKSYNKTFLIFKILYNIYKENYLESIEILNKNYKFFRSSLDNLLIQKYTYFFCNYKLNNKNNVEKYYSDLLKLKKSKNDKIKVSPLYNWEFIDAIYYKSIYNFEKSKYYFENTNTKNMNLRELIIYYKEYEDLLNKLNLTNQAKK